MKRVGERPRPSQVEWLDELVAADGEVYLWTLDDLDEILSVLRSRWRLSGLATSWERTRDGLCSANVSERVPGGEAAA